MLPVSLSRCLAALLFALAPVLAEADEPQRPIVDLMTTLGPIAIELDAEHAPKTTANFLRYVNEGYYDGLVFHRVIDGFMVQGGGYNKLLDARPTHEPIQNEADNGLKNVRGSIAMARTGEPHSATAQFFINLVDNTSLDHTAPTPEGWGYAVFGRVIAGMEVVDAMAKVPTSARGPFPGDVPDQDILIEKATVRTGAEASP